MSKMTPSPGRQAAYLLLAAGVLSIVNNYLPGSENLDRQVLNLIGVLAIVAAGLAWITPWDRFHPRTTLVLAPVALTLIAVANRFGGVSAYSYAVCFVVLFTWIGIAHPPKTSFFIAPLAATAYVLPATLSPHLLPGGAVSSVTVAIPVCVLVAETVSRVVRRLEKTSAEAKRRAVLLTHLARATRRMSELDPDQVLAGVVDSAIGLGFEAAEICEYDLPASTYRLRHTRGLPATYTGGEHSADKGVAGRVRERRATVVVKDYANLPDGELPLRAEGYRAVIGSPVWCDGQIAAALVAGTRTRNTLAPEEVGAFELLAGQAGRALENARRFEAERNAVERLAELDRLKDDFISTGSHELRTPLTVVMGIGLTLEQRWDQLPDEERREMIALLNANSTRLANIVDTLLDFSRIEAGVQPEMHPVALPDLVGVVAKRLEALFVEHDLHAAVPPGLLVSADAGLIERVLENLLMNAVRHTPAGTRIEVSAGLESGAAVVAVSDNGPGIAAGDIPHLGRRFFRAGRGNTRPSRGTGLGLALTREILTLHGSALEVTSQPGHGARFAFRLPLAQAPRIAATGERRGA
jgi:signal transduction histidine kinase